MSPDPTPLSVFGRASNEAPRVCHVLLVDDDMELLDSIRSFLELEVGHFEVAIAQSGDEAFLRMVTFTPDVIVMDVGLPDINGIEILNPIQDIHPKAQIVVLTGHATPEQREAALRHGAIRFLEKPVELNAFRRLLKELGEHSQSREPAGLEGGMDVLDLVQMMFLCQKTSAVRFVYERHRATLRFERGDVAYIDDGVYTGDRAFYNMVHLWGEGRFYTLPEEAATELVRNNWTPTERLLMEGALLRDHTVSNGSASEHVEPVAPVVSEPLTPEALPTVQLEDRAKVIPEPPAEKKQISRDRLKALLQELMETEGARAAVLVDWDGFVIEGRARSGVLPMDTIGAVISTSLGSTQVIGRELRIGNGNMAVLEFQKGCVLARAIGEHGILALLLDLDAKLGLPRCQILRLAPEIEAAL